MFDWKKVFSSDLLSTTNSILKYKVMPIVAVLVVVSLFGIVLLRIFNIFPR